MEPLKISPQSPFTEICNPDMESLLVLKKSSSSSKCSSIEFDFVGSSDKEISSNGCVSEFLPSFNVDKKFYTPAFVLKMDRKKYEIRDKLYFSLHRDRVQSNINQETTNIKIAKPFEFLNYCMVCKKDYHDYRKSESHHSKMVNSQFCKDIDELCLKFGNKSEFSSEKIVKGTKKTKKIRKLEKSASWIQKVETKCEFEPIF